MLEIRVAAGRYLDNASAGLTDLHWLLHARAEDSNAWIIARDGNTGRRTKVASGQWYANHEWRTSRWENEARKRYANESQAGSLVPDFFKYAPDN